MSTITTRTAKGTPLTHVELDANFTNLNTDKLQIGQAQAAGTANSVPYLNSSKVLTSGAALTFDASGNLGIGTNSPAAKLDVNGNIQIGSGRIGYAPDTEIFISGGVTYGHYGLSTNTGLVGLSGFYGVGLFTSGAERLRIDASGNLGLGVPPSAWQANYQTIQIAGSSSLSLTSSTNDSHISTNAYYNAGWKYQTSSVASSRYGQTSGVHSWFTAPAGTADAAITFTQAMTLDQNGNLLVGTTSVASTVSAGGAQVYLNAFGSGQTSFDIGHITGTPTAVPYERFFYNGTAIGSITQSGTTAVLYNTTSDQRLKDNIQNAPEASELIDAIQVRSFDWKSDGSHQRYGFVAQELVTVAPEAVHAPADPDEMMAVDYSKLVPMLIKEVQSLRARVAALENT